MAEQNFSNHAKYFPLFHFVVLPILAFNFFAQIHIWWHAGFPLHGFLPVLTSFGILGLAFAARLMALKVQDRVIRLEETLRFERLLPADLKPRISEFTPGQFVALRFAGDAELPELARKVLTDKITDGKAIKQMVKNWRADYLRA